MAVSHLGTLLMIRPLLERLSLVPQFSGPGWGSSNCGNESTTVLAASSSMNELEVAIGGDNSLVFFRWRLFLLKFVPWAVLILYERGVACLPITTAGFHDFLPGYLTTSFGFSSGNGFAALSYQCFCLACCWSSFVITGLWFEHCSCHR